MIKILILLLIAGNAMAIEEANFRVIADDGALEIRQYPPHVVAETLVQGEFKDVGNNAFRRLAGYIFGKNDAEENIAMTAPVTQQATEDGYIVRFYMPAEHNLDDLPVPLDDSVNIYEAAGGVFAVLRYKGGWKQDSYLKHKDQLIAQLEQNAAWQISGEPTWARYNSPLMPSFLRTNEILIPVEPR
jgi:DNA gyrase inhibitor GyrI